MKPSKLIYVIPGILVLVGGIWLYSVFYGPNEFTEPAERSIIVSRGQSFDAVVDSLTARGIVRSRSLFVFVSKVLGGTRHIQVGKFVFRSGLSNVEIARWLRDGTGVVPIQVVIREGLRSQRQARIFARALGVDSARYMELVQDQEFIRSLGIDAPSLEGYLLPETYTFTWQPDEREIIKWQVKLFRDAYNDTLQGRAREIGWTTNQVLTMASIIEGEAVIDQERPTVSGVYHNRLRKRMRLEADPTVQFLIEDGPRRVRYADLRKDSPYNTYRVYGLPPGPISSPGLASIRAALFPEKHDYLYFVANGQGGHWFSTNYVDHSKHVRRYRKARTLGSISAVSSSHGPVSVARQ